VYIKGVLLAGCLFSASSVRLEFPKPFLDGAVLFKCIVMNEIRWDNAAHNEADDAGDVLLCVEQVLVAAVLTYSIDPKYLVFEIDWKQLR
jgi:hypothetical protein